MFQSYNVLPSDKQENYGICPIELTEIKSSLRVRSCTESTSLLHSLSSRLTTISSSISNPYISPKRLKKHMMTQKLRQFLKCLKCLSVIMMPSL